MLTYGWRIPLLLGAPFGLVALFLRLRLKESSAYQSASGGRDPSGGRAGSNSGARSWTSGGAC